MERKKFGRMDEESAKEIIAARNAGLSYSEISQKYGVGKWWCIQHLRTIRPTRCWVEERWKAAEKEAHEVLLQRGFEHILNLNEIFPSPYWDYYAEKGKERWLFDITVNEQKGIAEKGIRMIEGFKAAVLLKGTAGWKILEIKIGEF